MAIPNNIDFSAFDTLTAAQMDDLIENDTALAAGTAIDALSHAVTAIANPYKFRAYRNGNQTVATSTPVKVQLNAESWDTNNNFDSTTNFRYTVPVSGFYHFSARVENNGNNYLVTQLWKNGASIALGSQVVAPSGAAASVLSDSVQLVASDYIELYCYNDNSTVGGATAQNTFLTGFLISRT